MTRLLWSTFILQMISIYFNFLLHSLSLLFRCRCLGGGISPLISRHVSNALLARFLRYTSSVPGLGHGLQSYCPSEDDYTPLLLHLIATSKEASSLHSMMALRCLTTFWASTVRIDTFRSLWLVKSLIMHPSELISGLKPYKR